MRLISSVVSLAILGAGLYWVDQRIPSLRHVLIEKVTAANLPTLEIRYSAQQVIQANKHQLRDKSHSSSLKLAPYLLMHVKHAKNPNKTEEGVILWDLTDGEMVLNTKTWTKTHGYGDCITHRATTGEFAILNAIAASKNSANLNYLIKSLPASSELITSWVENCHRKKLIVKSDARYRLHMQNPLFAKNPETIVDAPLVTINQTATNRSPKRFSAAQIKKSAEAAFGDDFAVQSTQEIFLPFYAIASEINGTLSTTYWNAVTGQRLNADAKIQ